MKRLTERIDGWVIRKGCHGPCRTCNGAGCADIYRMVDRLAAYEDTGLEPGEVVAMKIVLLGRELAKITDVDGVSINRICELARAEKDGRMVILPPNDPLTLEELREMDGEPVWCEILIKSAKPSCYAIIHDGVATGFVKGKRINLGCDKIGGYGLAWVAYRRKPEEGEK